MQNRVIKFRAWDGYRMILPEQIFGDVRDEHILSFNGELFFLYEESNGSWCPSTISSRRVRESTLMQFTGLTDKNGVEIYEGDVVEKCYGSSVKTGVVAWHQERAMFILQDGFNEPLYQLPLNMIEVIGNVFENPELLNP